MSSLSISSRSRIFGAAGQRYFEKRSRCFTATTFVPRHLMTTSLDDDEPDAFTSEPGKTLVMSSTALRRSWSPPSQLKPYSTVNEGLPPETMAGIGVLCRCGVDSELELKNCPIQRRSEAA